MYHCHRHIATTVCFGQMSRCIKRFLEELLISSGVQFFVLKIQARFTPGPNPPRNKSLLYSYCIQIVSNNAARRCGAVVAILVRVLVLYERRYRCVPVLYQYNYASYALTFLALHPSKEGDSLRSYSFLDGDTTDWGQGCQMPPPSPTYPPSLPQQHRYTNCTIRSLQKVRSWRVCGIIISIIITTIIIIMLSLAAVVQPEYI